MFFSCNFPDKSRTLSEYAPSVVLTVFFCEVQYFNRQTCTAVYGQPLHIFKLLIVLCVLQKTLRLWWQFIIESSSWISYRVYFEFFGCNWFYFNIQRQWSFKKSTQTKDSNEFGDIHHRSDCLLPNVCHGFYTVDSTESVVLLWRTVGAFPPSEQSYTLAIVKIMTQVVVKV